MQNSNSVLYGRGIFTTIDIRHNEPYLWEKHWRRLIRDSEKVGIDLSEHEERSTLDNLVDAIAKSAVKVRRARITFADEQSSPFWPNGRESGQKTRLSIITGERRHVPDYFQVTVSPFPVNSRSPLAGVKSCNYLENLLAIQEAKRRGFHEAIRLNERGHVTAGCMANIFWMKNGKMFTPSLSTGCVPGTTRESILDTMPCEQVEARIDDLLAADIISFNSAGLGTVAAHDVNGHSFCGFPVSFGKPDYE